VLEAKMAMAMRVGVGYDAHAFAAPAAGRPLLLGGVSIPSARGLAGHSDGDALLHAIVDALLGALALGDIGQHFPSSDPRWRDAASATFLRQARDLLAERGWRTGNIDATVVAEQPRLTPHVPAMRAHIADDLGVALDQVSVKSKTSDRLGFTGREEGIACYAVALIERD
jgi:2-C-methyl-D-erythritol 2,4-cyclodiphosphate synthase